MSRTFKEVRDSINAYPDYALEEQLGIHQGKALGSKFSESATRMAGHSSAEMTDFY